MIAEFFAEDWRQKQGKDELMNPWMFRIRNVKKPWYEDITQCQENATML